MMLSTTGLCQICAVCLKSLNGACCQESILLAYDEVQHGFGKGHGTVTAALENQQLITPGHDSKKFIALFTSNMSAAFASALSGFVGFQDQTDFF